MFHGSRKRDLDVFAFPWKKDCIDGTSFAMIVIKNLNFYLSNMKDIKVELIDEGLSWDELQKDSKGKPFGRRSKCILFKEHKEKHQLYIDFQWFDFKELHTSVFYE